MEPNGLTTATIEKQVLKLLRNKGPLLGSRIMEAVAGDPFRLWRTCKLSGKLRIRSIARRYLRLDPQMQGLVRLSPSIWREFLTYSLVGLNNDSKRLEIEARRLESYIAAISSAKAELAYRIAAAQAARLESEQGQKLQLSFLLAGDIVYNMAHDVPRPEKSTGKPVRGSDIDLVVIVDASFPQDCLQRLDKAIYEEKQNLIMNPNLREEIDYIVKNLHRVRRQAEFDNFRHMLACKIMQESTLLFGNQKLFTTVKNILREKGATRKLMEMENRARLERRRTESALLAEPSDGITADRLHLFYPTAEAAEFE